MGTRVLICTNCCTNCNFEGDSFTDGTFHCTEKDEYLDEEIKDCDLFEFKTDEDEEDVFGGY